MTNPEQKAWIFRPPSHLGLCHLQHTYQVQEFVGLCSASCGTVCLSKLKLPVGFLNGIFGDPGDLGDLGDLAVQLLHMSCTQSHTHTHTCKRAHTVQVTCKVTNSCV